MFYDTMQLNFRNTGHLYMELLVGLLCAHVVPKHPKSMVAMYENLYYARCDFKWSCTTPWLDAQAPRGRVRTEVGI